MPDPKKEPMIGKASRPTAIDYEASVSGLKVGELISILGAHAEQAKAHPEYVKPEHFKEVYKPEYYKPEYFKPDVFKEYKETVKEKEFTGPTGDPVEQLATRVAEILKKKS
jgi:hypothetical protein